jgi:phosphoribosyl-ATP pyrophosphohydrolase
MSKEDLNQLEELCREAYGAYEYLRDHDLSAESGTSKRLRNGDFNKLRMRLVEELGELRGVIEGTHVHEGFEQDIILEGYEVWYWAACWMAAQGFTYDEVQPHLYLDHGFRRRFTKEARKLDALQMAEHLIANFNESTPLHDNPPNRYFATGVFCITLNFIGMACRLNNTPPARLLERDIEEMRQKAYLAEYWRELV